MGESAKNLQSRELSTNELKVYEKKRKAQTTVMGLPLFWFSIFLAITLVTVYTGNLPAGMIGSLLVMVVLGEALGWLGDRLPIIKSYLGGGAIVAIFGSAYMVYAGLLPESVITGVDEFMTTGGFLDFYIAALITGSILGMNSKVLMKIGVRYFVPIFGAVIGAMLIAGIVGFLIGFSVQDAVLVIALPILGGGMGAGAIPMAQVYSEFLGNPPSYYISILVPALALGNVFAIIFASLLNSLGNKMPSLSGNGQLIPGFKIEEKKSSFDISKMGIGLLAALLFFACGHLLGAFIPLHPYALMIILVALVKILDLIPEAVVEGASQWYQFVAKTWTLALLFGIGVAFTDLNSVLSALSMQYILLVAGVVFGAVLGAALLGRLVGFYPIESAISAGLCMANMGGTGDVAVLSAAKRMQLMPFAQIASRLGGALILLLAGLIIPLLV
ncbi:2-hydroxycarboxylate transporter family protein [Alkalihalophilus lindianensis]|uniref:2-hydroxycarboxylate transporter family protein n=1 Tax=Alkalihalophilus lindianensis TaxID=1630542 RepID=A0ABU3XEY6_9BACI|nr:2-hydroxycarboxylate transporter family protein [Alkalihalophilus lindianensis]MDV2686450.1 2-hydroxycarboxylate transporter family protein [Alkalihalophilus lindianensis]